MIVNDKNKEKFEKEVADELVEQGVDEEPNRLAEIARAIVERILGSKIR